MPKYSKNSPKESKPEKGVSGLPMITLRITSLIRLNISHYMIVMNGYCICTNILDKEKLTEIGKLGCTITSQKQEMPITYMGLHLNMGFH